MQDRYAGDIGDFGKIALLRQINKTGLSIGVNWYKVDPKDFEKNKDGSYKQDDGKYCITKKYRVCDEELADRLIEIYKSQKRSIRLIEKANFIDGAKYFSDEVSLEKRSTWHKKALKKLKDFELVFLDPDNGMLVKSVKRTTPKSIKYVFYEEVEDYLNHNQSVLIYNHRSRKKENIYFQEIINKFQADGVPKDRILAITFPRYSIRDYIAICSSQEHYEKIHSAFETMLSDVWGDKQTGICRRPKFK